MLARFRSLHAGPMLAVGVSLGGNALLRYAEEAGESAAARVAAIAAVSAPLDLAAGARAIGRGFGRQVYTRMFLRTMKRKALVKLRQHPGLFDAAAMRAARDLRDFDEVFTAPLHGFRRRRRLLRARLGQAAAGPDPDSGAGAQRAQRPVPAGGGAAGRGRGRRARHALAAAPRRPRRLRARPLAGASAYPAGERRRLARRAPLSASARKIAPWTPSSPRPSRSGPTCRTATPGSRSTRAATGTCATTGSRRPGRSRASRAAASSTRSCASSSPATTPATTAARGSSRTGRSASTSSSRRRRGSGACSPTRRSAVVVTSHTGLPAEAGEAFLDESGRLFLASDLGLGIVHTLDMDVAGDAVERGAWRPDRDAVRRAGRALRLSPEPGRREGRLRRKEKAGARPAAFANRRGGYFAAATM